MKNIVQLAVALIFFWGLANGAKAQTNITKTSISAPNNLQVNTYTGSLFHQREDLRIPGRGLSAVIAFSYNSSARDKNWGYGRGWTHSYNMAYYPDSASIVVQKMDGRRNRYFQNPGGGYSRPTGVFDSLEQYEPGKFRLLMNDGTKYFFDNAGHKKLTKVQDRNGNNLTFAYTDTLLTTLTDASGREILFTWANGRMTKITDPNTTPAREILYEYDPAGNPTRVTDPLGNHMDYTYDDAFKMTAVINQNGIPVNIEYNSLTAVRRLISCVGVQTISYNYELRRTYLVEKVGGTEQITTFQYDTQGRLIRQSGNCCGSDVQYEYDAANNITKRTDANGNATTYTYDSKGNVLQEVDPLGKAIVYAYEPNFNFVSSVTDRNGNQTTQTYDAQGNLIQRNKPLGVVEVFTYDAYGNPLTYKDGRNHTTTYTYDQHGNLTGILDPENGQTTMAYDSVGNNTAFTDPNGHTTAILYDKLNRETKITNALGHFVEYTYDPAGNQTSFKDLNGHVKTFNYDGVNRLVATTDALGHTTSLSYDEHGNLTVLKDANGHETKFEYNTLNRLTRKTSPVGDQTLYDYDGVGNLTSVSLPGGNSVSVIYDQLNRIQQINDALGVVAKYTYDHNSNKLSVADGNDNTTRYTYDALNRVVKSEDPSGKASLFAYDKNDNLLQVTDRKGNVSIFTYDNLDRRKTSKDPLNNITTFNYSPAGNLLSIVDAKNQTTTYAYDSTDRRITETFANGDQRGFSYDAAGNLIAQTFPNGYTVTYTYDNANQLTSRNYPDGTSEAFTYDNTGKLLTANNPTANVSMTYDAADRLTQETLNGKNTNYLYNTTNRTRKITYPGGKMVTEKYDQRGRLEQINDSAIPGNTPLASLEYDPGNRLLRKVFFNNTTAEFAYDLNSNVLQINHTLSSLVRYDYAYDFNDNKLYEENEYQPTKSNHFTYDNYNRLTRFKKGTLVGGNIPSPSTDIQFALDGVHNRQTVQVNTTTTTYTANNVNQYTMLAGGTTATLTYDANGNLLSDGAQTYQYDYENRLVSVGSGAVGKYFYDALGRRVLKVVGPDSTFFFYAQLRVIEERASSSGAVAATYTYGSGLDEVLTMERAGQRYFYHTNALGSVTQLTNSAGEIVEQYEYDSYGAVSIFDGAYLPLTVSAVGNPVLFTGQRLDAESGLYFYKSRYYSALLGRFLQRDPLGFVDGPSLYEYVYSSPGMWIDPLGLSGNPCDKPWWEKGLDWLQRGLDIAGLFPGLGELADGLNAGIYAARGDWANAAWSAAAMIPGAGWGATAAKYANKSDNAVDVLRAADHVKDAEEGGLNLFKFGSDQAKKADGWKEGDRFLHLPDHGSPKANWKQNHGRLREEMGKGEPIFDSYRNADGSLIPTKGFLNAERQTLQSRGWTYNPTNGAWLPPIK